MKNLIKETTSLLIGNPGSENLKKMKRKLTKQNKIFKQQILKNINILECIKKKSNRN